VQAQEEEQEHACEEKSHSAAWSCPACTFLNCSLLPACEMCQTQKDAEPAKYWLDAVRPSAMPPQEALSDESSLEDDEWVHCEMSSVGSSWLDVDGANVREEDDGEASAVMCSAGSTGATPPAVTSWAARAKNVAGQGVTVKAPAHGTAMPPLKQRALKESEPREYKAEEEEEEVAEFMDMQARRLHSQVSRGITKRLRVARRHC